MAEDLHKGFVPEHNLVAAVLHVGITDAVSERRMNRDNIKTYESQAWGWIFNDDLDPFCFLWCCHMLDLDPEPLRDFVRSKRCTRGRRMLVRWE